MYWANAVVLRNNDTYKVGDIIPEEAIESYFVWIPKYSYQLWDLGNYTSLTSLDNTKPHAIPIRFGTTNTKDATTGECTTPRTAGSSGNCKVGDYMTHPAFLAFNTNGFSTLNLFKIYFTMAFWTKEFKYSSSSLKFDSFSIAISYAMLDNTIKLMSSFSILSL